MYIDCRDPSDEEEDEQSEVYFDESLLDDNVEEEDDDSLAPWRDYYGDQFDTYFDDSESNLSGYVDDKQYDDDKYDINEERRFAGLKNAVIDTTSSGFHLQSGNTNIDDRYRSKLTHEATSKFGDFIVSYLFTSVLDNGMTSTSSYYISKQNLNPTTQSECTPVSKLFIGNIDARVTRQQLEEYFRNKDHSIKRLYFKKNPVRLSREKISSSAKLFPREN